MLILNVGISYNSKSWLMWLTIESEKTKKMAKFREEMLVQTGTPFSHWVILGVVNLGFRSGLYGWKVEK